MLFASFVALRDLDIPCPFRLSPGDDKRDRLDALICTDCRLRVTLKSPLLAPAPGPDLARRAATATPSHGTSTSRAAIGKRPFWAHETSESELVGHPQPGERILEGFGPIRRAIRAASFRVTNCTFLRNIPSPESRTRKPVLRAVLPALGQAVSRKRPTVGLDVVAADQRACVPLSLVRATDPGHQPVMNSHVSGRDVAFTPGSPAQGPRWRDWCHSIRRRPLCVDLLTSPP